MGPCIKNTLICLIYKIILNFLKFLICNKCRRNFSMNDSQLQLRSAKPLDLESVTRFIPQVAGHEYDFKKPTVNGKLM